MDAKATKAIKVFYSYAHEDEVLRDKLEKQFRPLKHQGYITEWYDRVIQAGTPWESEINVHLSTADIILLLISADFIASDYCWSVEMEHALERHRAGDCRIVPIILRDAHWEATPLSDLQVLPQNGKAITAWPDMDEAMKDVAVGLWKVVTSLLVKRGDPQTIYTQLAGTSPTFFDRLDRQTSRQWKETSQVSFFEKEAFHVCAPRSRYNIAFAQKTNLSDFAFQVEMTLLEGRGGGMGLRCSGNDHNGHPRGYRWGLSRYGFSCAYGETALLSESWLAAKLNHPYLLTTIAYGDNLSFFIDKQYLTTVTDGRANSGKIGLMSWNEVEQDRAHAIFRNAKAWDLTNNSQW